MQERTKDIFTVLSKKYNLNRHVIELICNEPFAFTKERMMDLNDTKTIMIHYLGKFSLRKKYLNDKIDAYERKKQRKLYYKKKSTESIPAI